VLFKNFPISLNEHQVRNVNKIPLASESINLKHLKIILPYNKITFEGTKKRPCRIKKFISQLETPFITSNCSGILIDSLDGIKRFIVQFRTFRKVD
jgi:hypothetical protein